MEAALAEEFTFADRDVIAITESVVARAQGNYATLDDIKQDIIEKFGENQTIGVVFPILSRNRFAMCLKGIARAAKKVVILLSYPSDEVGNELFNEEKLLEKDINPYTEVYNSEKEYRDTFGINLHPFTGIDYVEYYGELVRSEGKDADFIFSNHPEHILNKTQNVLLCDIHTLRRTRRSVERKSTADTRIFTLCDIMTKSINGSGYNERYGLLGSNKADEQRVKLFPHSAQDLVEAIQKEMLEKTGHKLEVMIYGDGAFKDPVGGIWEFADPVVSPNYTAGLAGTPNELKLKYLADNEYKALNGKELEEAIREKIENKNKNLKGTMATEGTTPRQITDLLGSLCDLTSGSGDKGTPVVLIQGYFDNFANK